MTTVNRFEDLDVWQKARELVNRIYAITRDTDFARDHNLINQLRRASVSVMSNIAEGFERDGTREFIQFLSIAKGSSGEVRSQLYVAADQGYISKAEFETLEELSRESSRLISGLMAYLKKSGKKGIKYS